MYYLPHKLEQPQVLQCAHQCKEQLQFNAIEQLVPGEVYCLSLSLSCRINSFAFERKSGDLWPRNYHTHDRFNNLSSRCALPAEQLFFLIFCIYFSPFASSFFQDAIFAADTSFFTLKANTAADLSLLLQQVTYVNKKKQPTPGHRIFAINTTVQCTDGKSVIWRNSHYFFQPKKRKSRSDNNATCWVIGCFIFEVCVLNLIFS